jgi:hypothetical protein
MKIQPLFHFTLCAMAFSVASTTGLIAQDDVGPAGPLVAYSQDFENLDLAIVSDEKFTNLWSEDNWRVFGNAFAAGTNPGELGGYLYGYGPFFAPNNLDSEAGGVGFSQVGEESEGGNRFLNVFNDYNNEDHRNGSNNVMNSLIFQDRAVVAGDVGSVWRFDFDYRNADGGFGVADDTSGVSSANAFVKVLRQSDNSFGEIDRGDVDTSTATSTFQSAFIDFEIKSEHVGELLQFGFESFASNDSPTGVFYDNLSFAIPSALLGDFDNDGDVDLADLDQYNQNLGKTVAANPGLADLDLDGSGTIDAADFAQHYGTLVETSNGGKGTALGDVNLDGVVNVLGDAFALVGNLNNPATSWSQGDLNADGNVNVLGDAFGLVGNLGANNGGGSGAPAASAVPEPGSLSLLGLTLIGIAVRRRR